jgi:hypothetical protein
MDVDSDEGDSTTGVGAAGPSAHKSALLELALETSSSVFYPTLVSLTPSGRPHFAKVALPTAHPNITKCRALLAEAGKPGAAVSYPQTLLDFALGVPLGLLVDVKDGKDRWRPGVVVSDLHDASLPGHRVFLRVMKVGPAALDVLGPEWVPVWAMSVAPYGTFTGALAAASATSSAGAGGGAGVWPGPGAGAVDGGVVTGADGAPAEVVAAM